MADEKKSDEPRKPTPRSEEKRLAAPPKPVPRVCEPHERAEPGLRRYKLRAANYGARGYRYVLAADRAAAEALYLAHEGLADPPAGAEPVQVTVTELSD